MPDIFGEAIINRFDNENSFLSNFHPAQFALWGIEFNTSEHAYQWAKTLLPDEKDRVLFILEERTVADGVEFIRVRPTTAWEAKKAGATLTKRADWEDIRFDIMIEVLLAKFGQNQVLKERLLSTGDAVLIEGNHWHDNIWGICKCGKKARCDGSGLNMLGLALMHVRGILGS